MSEPSPDKPGAGDAASTGVDAAIPCAARSHGHGEATGDDIWLPKQALNFCQCASFQLAIGMQEEKNVACGVGSPGVHLPGTSWSTVEKHIDIQSTH